MWIHEYMQIIKKARTDVLLIICSGFFYFLLCSCLYLALNSASSEESFARLFLPTLVISRYIAASIAIGIAAVSIVDKVSVNTPFSNMDFTHLYTGLN